MNFVGVINSGPYQLGAPDLPALGPPAAEAGDDEEDDEEEEAPPALRRTRSSGGEPEPAPAARAGRSGRGKQKRELAAAKSKKAAAAKKKKKKKTKSAAAAAAAAAVPPATMLVPADGDGAGEHTLYRLRAAIVHHGSGIGKGHYVSHQPIRTFFTFMGLCCVWPNNCVIFSRVHVFFRCLADGRVFWIDRIRTAWGCGVPRAAAWSGAGGCRSGRSWLRGRMGEQAFSTVLNTHADRAAVGLTVS